jgi:RsiW-degrading membrane proteinase PrsW (M82 family)
MLTGIISVCQWQFILSIVIEMTSILGIRVFVTKQSQQKDQAQRQLEL